MNTENTDTNVLFNLFEIIFLRKTQIIVAFLIVFGITIIGAIRMPPVYTASATVYVSSPVLPRGDVSYLSDVQSSPMFLENQLAFVRTRSVYEKVAKTIPLNPEPSFLSKVKSMFFKSDVDPLEKSMDFLYRTTSVQLRRGTNIIEITATVSSAKMAADIANAIANSYTAFANTLLLNKSKDAYNFVTGHFNETQRDYSTAQRKLLDFMKANNVTSIESVRAERANVQNVLNGLKLKYLQPGIRTNEQEDESTLDIQFSSSDTPQVKEIKADLQKLKNELIRKQQQFTDQHPQILALKDDIDKKQKELSRETRGMEQSTSQKNLQNKNQLAQNIQKLEGEVSRLLQVEIQLTELMNNARNKEKGQMLVQEQVETASSLYASAMQRERVRILDPAYTPTGPTNKKRLILLSVGFIVAILFSLGSAFIVEHYDDSLKSREEVELALGLPVLGSIPGVVLKKAKRRNRREEHNLA